MPRGFEALKEKRVTKQREKKPRNRGETESDRTLRTKAAEAGRERENEGYAQLWSVADLPPMPDKKKRIYSPRDKPLGEYAAEGAEFLKEAKLRKMSLSQVAKERGISKHTLWRRCELAREVEAGWILTGYRTLKEAEVGLRERKAARAEERDRENYWAGLLSGESSGENLRYNEWEPPR